MAAVILVSCSSGSPSAAPGLEPISLELHAYASRCAQILGRLSPWSCLDGRPVPVTTNGQLVGAGSSPVSCDRPSWLVEDACVPGTRVGHLASTSADGSPEPDVDWIFICRRLEPRPDDDPVFENLGLIGHDRATGATCFFQGPDGVPTDMRRVPPPDEHPATTPPGAPRADEFWSATEAVVLQQNRCLDCHDSSPWIHSPFIDQVDVVPVSALGTPYVDLDSGSSPPTFAPAGNPCTTCHRMGMGASCTEYIGYATGVPPTLASEHGRTWPASHSMPPEPVSSRQEHVANFGPWIAQLIDCCEGRRDEASCGVAARRIEDAP